MRARSIKPGLFKNDLLGKADPLYTVIFEGLWCLADREGRLEDRPSRIHAEINPYRTEESTVQALCWLDASTFITRYESGGRKYILVNAFREHQQPHIKEAQSKIPPPQNQGVVVAPDKTGANTSVAALTPDSGLLTADSGILTADKRAPATYVPRDTLSQDFSDFLLTEYPQCTGRRSWNTALHNVGVILETGRASEDDLRRRMIGYRAHVTTGGVSGPERVYTPQNFFELHGEDPPWAKEWSAPKSKAQVQQDANISAGQAFLNRNRGVA